ncbi:PTS sugar transporter subunit IIA [Aminobacter sp. HY435]|uniref:PTS sugar transporter subunit IIA n=1 Tax=Aminobacter sp. HY435 TaxID=2970917 RepID=UPI0022B99A08|nr:PTS sugar transporter subunit IIA [Aminobacter sp. HY435]
MNFHDVIQPEDVILGLEVDSKTRLLKELARHAAQRSDASASDITAALAARERLGSTGLGDGIAIPHAKVRGLAKPFAAFVRLARPCPFEAVDDQNVDIVVLLLLPETSPKEYLNLLARIARLLRDAELVARLRQSDDTAAIHRLLGGDPSLSTATAAA